MDMQLILQEIQKFFTDDSLILVPCLYIVLWSLKKTPMIKKVVWLYSWIILVIGALFSVLLSGFSFYIILRGFLAAGLAEFLFYVNEKKSDIKCNKTNTKKPKNKKQ